jgi:hypothetical protein
MTNVYENVVEEFNKRGCLLLNTKEEYYEILKNAFKSNYKLNYTASCGHNHIVFYNVFKSRGTGIKCPSCVNKRICNDTKEKMKNNEITKLCKLEQEFNFIQLLKELVKNYFDIIKAFDGCIVDIILKPKNILENNWIGIQIKTTNNRHLTYSFHINNNYKDCLLLFYCYEDESMWLIPENIIQNQKKVSIGFNKSKYNIYKVSKNDIIDKLHELYNITTKFDFDILNTPINIYQQREQDFCKYRESKIDFIKFDYNEMEGTTYDFKIGNYKIQEKVTKMKDGNKYIFFICKKNGYSSNKTINIQYDIGDNDFYWLNCENKRTFFVIPEKALIEKNLVGNIKKTVSLKVTITDTSCVTNPWLQPYMFDYENIEKDRLLSILHQGI